MMECATPINPPKKLFEQLGDAHRKFDRAVDQINVIDLQLRDLETRYKRAVKNKKSSFRYNLRLKLSVATGIKMMYNHFATKKAEEIRQLTRQVVTIYGAQVDGEPANPETEPLAAAQLQDNNLVRQEDVNASAMSPSQSSDSSIFSDNSTESTQVRLNVTNESEQSESSST